MSGSRIGLGTVFLPELNRALIKSWFFAAILLPSAEKRGRSNYDEDSGGRRRKEHEVPL